MTDRLAAMLPGPLPPSDEPIVRYADIVPYDRLATLNDLRVPTTGIIRLKGPIDTSLDPTYDLNEKDELWLFYTRVIRAGSLTKITSYLDRDTGLLGVWLTSRLHGLLWVVLEGWLSCRKIVTVTSSSVMRSRVGYQNSPNRDTTND